MHPLHFLIQFKGGGGGALFVRILVIIIAFGGDSMEGKEAKKENYDTLC